MADPTLFDARRHVEPAFLSARTTDPDTSVAAAASVTPGRTERLILEAFRAGDAMTDDEIAAALAPMHAPTVKTARSRLSKAGFLADSGARRASRRGRDQIVWRVV